VTPVAPGLIATADDGTVRLLGSRCRACGRPAFPRAATCPYCGSTEVDNVELSPTGTLWAWTAVTAAPPGYDGAVPFGFGVVELPEGLRVITRLEEADPAALAFGQPMRLVTTAVGTGDDGEEIVTWSFEAAS